MDLRVTLCFGLTLLAILAAPSQALAGSAAGPQPPSAASTAAQAETRVSAREAIAAARADPKAAELLAQDPELEPRARLNDGRWEVGIYRGEERSGLVLVDPGSGRVLESWTGYQVAWRMARGYSGAFGRKLNAPYVFIPLCLIFVAGLFDWRRPRRWANLDLLVLLGFTLSHFFFNRAEIGISVPLAYPVLGYLLARLLWIGFRGSGSGGGLRPVWPTAWLVIAIFFLIGFRGGLNLVDSGVADIGYASVVGADRISSGQPLYDNFPSDVAEGDTYGPANYYAYVPFELALPWSGEWDELPAAHAAALAFDLVILALLYLIGRRMRPGPAGRRLGVVLAFAWAAYPYSAYTLASNANDALVGALLLGALLLGARPLARGALSAAAVLTKFAPLPLIPLLARFGLEAGAPRSRRRLGLFALGLGGATVLLLAQTAIDPGLGTFYERTLGYQSGRDSPFSLWGQVPALAPVRVALVVAVAVLALITVRWPRRLDLTRTAALMAAILVGTQIAAGHWFYLYLPWFVPMALVAFAAGGPALTGAFSHLRRAASPVRSSGPDPAPRTPPPRP